MIDIGALADFPFIDVMANQRLLPPTFPRQTKLMSRSSALEYLQCLICRLKQVALLPVGGGSFDVVLVSNNFFNIHFLAWHLIYQCRTISVTSR